MDKRIFFLMNMAQHRLFKFVDSESEARLGISVTQVAAMLYIAKNEGCLQKDLSKALGLKGPAVTGLASRMERNALILRKPCEFDGRASRMYLTDKGKSTLPSVLPLLKEVNALLTEGFSEDEMEIVFRFLNHVMTRFDA